MLYGLVIKANCFSHVKLFCPDLTYVEYVPAYGDSFIINDPDYPTDQFKNRFRRSILLSASGYDLNLTCRKTVIRLLHKIRKVSNDAYNYFITLEDELEFWNAIKVYFICGKYREATTHSEYSFYPLFFNLGGDKRVLIRELSKLRDVPTPVIFSALLTFLTKMKKVDELRGISWRYRRDLIDVRARVSGVKRKVYRYLKSERELSDLLGFILSL